MHAGSLTCQEEIADERGYVTLGKRPFDDRRGEDGIGGARGQRGSVIVPSLRKTAPDDKRFEPTERGEEAGISAARRKPHALAKRPEMTTADSITGPRSTSKLSRILDLMHSLLGSVTPADSTWIPRTIRVNWYKSGSTSHPPRAAYPSRHPPPMRSPTTQGG